MALEVVGSNPTIHPIMNDTLQRVHIVRFRQEQSDSNGQKSKQSFELFACPGVIVQTLLRSADIGKRCVPVPCENIA